VPVPLNPTVRDVTDRIVERSHDARRSYRQRIDAAARGTGRAHLSCANIAHVVAASADDEKVLQLNPAITNVAIVSAYNDMLSAHQPLEAYPALIKAAVRELGATAQYAGGVPAMCDGVTQGRPGMELSLFSRDVIAMATAVALSHDAFDAVLCLGVCDKIVPGLLIGALAFGHLPAVFVPAGPMLSGLSNKKKAEVRALYAEGKVGREALLEVERQSYHSAGTCTFYGTANSNQMLMEIMGLHLPGTAFVNPGTALRDALTRASGRRAVELARSDRDGGAVGHIVDEKAVVNGLVGLLATGGSTNHTIHLIAMAAAAGVRITWDDFADLSRVVPLLARVYPNGAGDVNHFHAAGGMSFVVRELLDGGLAHDDVHTVAGFGLRLYQCEPFLDDGALAWREGPAVSGDRTILRPVADPFGLQGGLRVLEGNLGRAVIKTSAVHDDHLVVEAEAIVFDGQDELKAAFERGELDRDFIAVVRFQGPRANGMPELHNLNPALSVLLDRGRQMALITDGRMSGASGKVPAAIHLTPEASDGGPLARVHTGDRIHLDATTGTLNVLVDPVEFAARTPAVSPETDASYGFGRELFGHMRDAVGSVERGASVFFAGR
jgi:phosphogluconate dehydratase